jgi:hypothetical protein
MRHSSRNLIPAGAFALVLGALLLGGFLSMSMAADDACAIPRAGVALEVKVLEEDAEVGIGHGLVTGCSHLSRVDISSGSRPLRLGGGIGGATLITEGRRLHFSPRTRVSIPLAIAADCSSDVTLPLLEWLATVPDGSAVEFGHGCYRIEGTLELRGRENLTLEGGTFRSFDPPEDQRAVWRLVDSAGFIFRDMSIVGSFQQSEVDPRHDPSLQHAHAIDLRGTSVEISHVRALRIAGDCVYFGLGVARPRRSSGAVRDSVCRETSRNAVSVTAGDDIAIERNVTSGIGLTAFDIEPNKGPGWGSSRVSVRDNRIGSYNLYAYALIGNAQIKDQSFVDIGDANP